MNPSRKAWLSRPRKNAQSSMTLSTPQSCTIINIIAIIIIVISTQTNQVIVSAWSSILPPLSSSSSLSTLTKPPGSSTTTSFTRPVVSSSLTDASSPSTIAYYPQYRRSRKIILSSLSSSSSSPSSSSPSSHHATSTEQTVNQPNEIDNDNEEEAAAAAAAAMPILRTLYDAPPRSSTDDETKNNTTTTDGNDANKNAATNDSEWVTQVTSGTLPTEEGSSHVLYYEVHRRHRRHEATSEQQRQQQRQRQQRKKRGLTALFLHGGPGAGCFPNHVRFFSPELYETVVLLDQRGCGRSVPLGETRWNTLELLVDDVERLRVRLLEEGEGGVAHGDGAGDSDADADAVVEAEEMASSSASSSSSSASTSAVRPWDVILGGSWGCTLALAYAHAHPNHVRGMVLRGVCLFRNREIDWLFGDPKPMTSGAKPTSNLRSLLLQAGGGGGGSGSGVEKRRSPATSFGRGGEDVNSRTKEPSSMTIAMGTASEMFPKGWKEFRKGSDIGTHKATTTSTGAAAATTTITTGNPRSILRKYYNLLLGSDPLVRFKALKSWMRWEMGIYSSGFRDAKGEDVDKTKTTFPNQNNNNNNINTTVLVWNPATASWAYEDARVWNNRSVASIDAYPRGVEEGEEVQSLRRYSSSPSLQSERLELLESNHAGDPIPVEPVIVPPDKSTDTAKSNDDKSGSDKNGKFDPTTYVPAQSMLTCYYSANDDYCIGPYKSFLSLALPSSLPLSSWYSSTMPPQLPHSSMTDSSPSAATTTTTTTTTSFPLPPTIAIQGGNDAICPPDTALDLHHVWNEMELRIVLEGGHSMYGDAVAGEIVKALDRFGHALDAESE